MSVYAGTLSADGPWALNPVRERVTRDHPGAGVSVGVSHPWATLEANRHLTDEDLIDRAVAGDDSAFVALYDRYCDRVFRYVYHRVSGWQDAEDVTQEVFLRAWRAIGRYRKTGSPFVAWLMVIAHNTAISYSRHPRKTRSVDPEDEDWASDERFEGQAEARVEHERIRLSLQRLPPEHQCVLTMRFLEDLSHRDIAAALGKTEGHVRVIQHRALGKLRRILDEGAA